MNKNEVQSPETHIPHHTRLGDTIIGVNNAIVLAKLAGKPLRFALHPKRLAWNVKEQKLYEQRLEAALYLFDHEGHLNLVNDRIDPVKVLSTHPQSCYLDNAKASVSCTTPRDIVCYHFRPRTGRVTHKDRLELTSFLSDQSEVIDCHDYGLKHGLIPLIEVMRTCRYFVGADSGMSHIAHAIGLEAHLIKFSCKESWLRKWHKFNQYTFYERVEDFTKTKRSCAVQ